MTKVAFNGSITTNSDGTYTVLVSVAKKFTSLDQATAELKSYRTQVETAAHKDTVIWGSFEGPNRDTVIWGS